MTNVVGQELWKISTIYHIYLFSDKNEYKINVLNDSNVIVLPQFTVVVKLYV